MTRLADQLEAEADALTRRVVEQMYTNPFWDERFGERGRQFAEEDGRYHVQHLATALRLGTPAAMEHYARWLQVVLTTRGMCSCHLAENFARLADAIQAADLPDAEQAIPYLRAAEEALVYQDGPARELQLAATQLADRCVAALYRRHPDWLARWGPAGRDRCRDDLLYHLSYLADAVALGKPEVFADYARWIAGFLARRGIPVEHLRETLVALDEALRQLPAEVYAAARPILAGGRDSLEKVSP